MNFAQTFTQVTPAMAWTINHTYSSVPITNVITLINGVATQILPKSVKAVSTTELLIEFSKPYSGVVRMYGNVEGAHPTGAVDSIDRIVPYPTVFYAGSSSINTLVDGFTAPFTVTRTGDTPAATLTWTIAPGDAYDGMYGAYDAGTPFSVTGTLTFLLGATSAVLNVTFAEGGTYLVPRTVTITISSPSVGTIGDDIGTIDFT